ncbi:hypothetical protein CEN49_05520 [Fischerella thermalis CCMEE 5273]|nr:hypothetical protein CBP17_20205 [Fischerella thermalis WC114]PLZ11078.1 hypothetical protein CBP19_13790 [Fischerella thermalis WC1110]PLZ13346.1 hypothetical protein CBP18_04970 [Fischerella thermalis WC119]PLZ17456.1 hypothetical protein CBP30_19950 [Fischerella thermalis WC157]PLZ27579.1 hypothetical protein CBP29_03775 [Fischerella thermalis WC341]PLZ34814.1 hypothetical protein CBP10_05070 [Fischerella thermalis WC558]PLZ41775.1 hypothetical protein CBP27_05055 [Fischerella thermalis
MLVRLQLISVTVLVKKAGGRRRMNADRLFMGSLRKTLRPFAFKNSTGLSLTTIESQLIYKFWLIFIKKLVKYNNFLSRQLTFAY